jgi:hypothetical protein
VKSWLLPAVVCVWPALSVAAAPDASVRVIRADEFRFRWLVDDVASNRAERNVCFPNATWDSLHLTVEIAGPAVAKATRSSSLRFTAIDDLGGALHVGPVTTRDEFMKLSRDEDPRSGSRDRTELELEMDGPSRAAKTVARVDGSVTLLTGDLRTLQIGRFQEHQGQPLSGKPLAEAGVQIKVMKVNARPGGGAIVEALGKVERIEEIGIVGGAGKPLGCVGAWTNDPDYGAETATFTVRCERPIRRDARLKVVLLTRAAETEVPIHLRDVPVP